MLNRNKVGALKNKFCGEMWGVLELQWSEIVYENLVF